MHAMPEVAANHLQVSVRLRISTPPDGARSREAQHAFLNGRTLAPSDPICKQLNAIHQAAREHVVRMQRLRADSCAPYCKFLAQITCPVHLCTVAREWPHFTASFAEWESVAAALSQACMQAWKAVLPDNVLREPLRTAEEQGRSRGRQVKRKRNPGLPPRLTDTTESAPQGQGSLPLVRK